MIRHLMLTAEPILDAAQYDDSLEANQSPISEASNVAYEMTRDGVPLVLEWLLSLFLKSRRRLPRSNELEMDKFILYGTVSRLLVLPEETITKST